MAAERVAEHVRKSRIAGHDDPVPALRLGQRSQAASRILQQPAPVLLETPLEQVALRRRLLSKRWVRSRRPLQLAPFRGLGLQGERRHLGGDPEPLLDDTHCRKRDRDESCRSPAIERHNQRRKIRAVIQDDPGGQRHLEGEPVHLPALDGHEQRTAAARLARIEDERELVLQELESLEHGTPPGSLAPAPTRSRISLRPFWTAIVHAGG